MRSMMIVVLLMLVACSKQSVYDSMRNDARWDCDTVPLSQQKECREQSSVSYDDYERERQELLNSDASSDVED
ncbi:hypothetical protein [Gilvimarinus agarilyticus]|uniref:hypothetical protein n=1 Tax=Gilvimarinus agarilyticus TaxID=679259 RepID=UPI0005A1CF43|nr:hypothetical protein [Gilvimarinus agarilyticus]